LWDRNLWSNPVTGSEGRQRGRIDKFNPVPGRHRCRHQLDLARTLDVPAQQHGVVLVLGVVAVLHVGPGKLTEPDGHLDTVGAVSFGADAIDILPCPFFPFGRCYSATGQDDPLLEVNMDRMAPAVLAKDTPDLQSPFTAEAGLGRTC